MNIKEIQLGDEWQRECSRIEAKPEATIQYLAGSFRALWRQEYVARRLDNEPPADAPKMADGYTLYRTDVELVDAAGELRGVFAPCDYYVTESDRDIESGKFYPGQVVPVAIWRRGEDIAWLMSDDQLTAIAEQIEQHEVSRAAA